MMLLNHNYVEAAIDTVFHFTSKIAFIVSLIRAMMSLLVVNLYQIQGIIKWSIAWKLKKIVVATLNLITRNKPRNRINTIPKYVSSKITYPKWNVPRSQFLVFLFINAPTNRVLNIYKPHICHPSITERFK